jgi:hypothetical protein
MDAEEPKYKVIGELTPIVNIPRYHSYTNHDFVPKLAKAEHVQDLGYFTFFNDDEPSRR